MGSVAPFGSLADQSSDAASDIDISDASVDAADIDLDDIGDTVSGDTGFLSILSNVKIPGVVIQINIRSEEHTSELQSH